MFYFVVYFKKHTSPRARTDQIQDKEPSGTIILAKCDKMDDADPQDQSVQWYSWYLL